VGFELLHVVMLGAGAAGGWLLASEQARARIRSAVRRADDLGAELLATQSKLAELQRTCDRMVETTSARITAAAREAQQAIKAPAVLGELEGIMAALSPARVGTGATTTVEQFEAVARHAEEAARDQERRLRMLLAESEALGRASDGADRVAAAMADVIGELERGASGLEEAAAAAVQATLQMDDALARVQGGAGDTAQISARVASEAERGYRAVHKTLDEIERIRELSTTARKRIDALGGRVAGIGSVVRVIQEIAEKTNLLALNASIIAAQAGEHGRGFAVVAQEIKALAQKTAASTKEISEQIRGVQEESGRAVEAMAAGVDAVSEGFQVAAGAGDSLGEIRQSARAAQKKVQGIARAMEEQAGASKRVVEAATSLSERASALSSTVRQESAHGDRLREAAAGVAEAASRIGRLAREQLRAGEEASAMIARALEDSTGVVKQQKELRAKLDRLHHGAAQIQGLEDAMADRLAAMNAAAAELREEIVRVTAA
jgi:methyl-accepting chemotaxis protein